MERKKDDWHCTSDLASKFVLDVRLYSEALGGHDLNFLFCLSDEVYLIRPSKRVFNHFLTTDPARKAPYKWSVLCLKKVSVPGVDRRQRGTWQWDPAQKSGVAENSSATTRYLQILCLGSARHCCSSRVET